MAVIYSFKLLQIYSFDASRKMDFEFFVKYFYIRIIF